MPSGTITKKRRGAATLALLGTAFSGTAAPTAVAMLAAAAGSVVLAEAANAAVITGAVKTMQIVETTVAQGQRVTVNGTWAVPDSAKAGDTFTFQMPGAIFSSILTPSIQLLDASGQVAANCTTSGLTMTCTLTNYVDQNANVHGTFRFQATVSKNAPVKDNTPITMTGSGGTFTDTIDVTEAKGGVKVMGMDQSDNNNDGITDQLFWKIETDPLVGGPGTVVVNDTPVTDDMVLLCGDIKVFKNGTILAKTAYTMTCSATGLKITIPGVANNSVIRVTGYANFVGPHTPGRIFTNNATVSAFGTTVKGAANFVYPEGGGTADGDQWVAVGDTVKEDVNNNGIQDTGDLPMQGVTLTLSRSDGKPVVDYLGNPVTLTQKTDANGHYLFDELSILPAGVKYQVAVTTPAGYAPAKTGAGTSQTDYNNPKATAVELTALGDEDLALDFGFVKIPPPAAPEIDIEKLGGPAGTTAEDADTPETAVTLPNGTANIDFVVTNTGNEGLKNVTVTDALISGPGSITGLSCTFPDGSTGTTWAGPLAVGDSFPCTAQLAGVTPGSTHLDTATVTGVGVTSNTTVTDEDDFNAIRPELPVPGIDIEKEGNAAGELPVDADTAAEAVVLPDGTANIIFTVTNTGAEALEDVTVSDAVISGPAKVEGLECTFPDDSTGITWAGPFAIGDSFTCTAQLSGLTPGASHLDTATVTGTGVVSGNDVTDKDDFNATRDELPPVLVPEIDIEKLGNVAGSTPVDADTAAEAVTLPDGTGQITFEITNNGEEALKDIAVTDAVISGPATVDGLECTFPDDSTGTTWAGPFAVGDTFTCTASLSGLTAGSSHLDTATVTGVGVTSGTTVTDKDDFNAIRDVVKVPSIDIEKLGGPEGTVALDADTAAEAVTLPDGTAQLSFVVTNNGDEDLKAITVSDELVSGPGKIESLSCTFPDGSTGLTWDGPLASGDSFPCTASLTGVTPGSKHLDTATVVGVGVDSGTDVTDSDDFNAITPPKPTTPSVDVEKTDEKGNDADTADDAANLGTGPGSVKIVETFTNNGTEPLKDVVLTETNMEGGTVTDFICTLPDGTKLTGKGPDDKPQYPTLTATWAGPWAPGETIDCTAMLTGVTGKHKDVASVTATGATSGTPVKDDDEYHAVVEYPKPAISIVKKMNGKDADTAETAVNLGDGGGDGIGEGWVDYTVSAPKSNTEGIVLDAKSVWDVVKANGKLKDFVCELPKANGAGKIILKPGQSFDCKGYLYDIKAGSVHKDIGYVKGVGENSGIEVSDDNPLHVVVSKPDTPPIIDTGAGAGYSSGAGIDGWLLGSGLGLMALAGVGGAMAYRRKKAVNEMSPAA